jgi:hypothetical protein
MVIHELTETNAKINLDNQSLGALEKGDCVRLRTEVDSTYGTRKVSTQKVGRIACILSSDRGVQAIGFREASGQGYDPAEMMTVGRLENTTIDVLTDEQAHELGLAQNWQVKHAQQHEVTEVLASSAKLNVWRSFLSILFPNMTKRR